MRQRVKRNRLISLNLLLGQPLIDVLAIGLARDLGAIGSLNFGRHESAGPIGRRELSIAHMLVPHLQRAATINRMLEGAAAAQDGFVATLDAVAVPILLLDSTLLILHANIAAQNLLKRATLIREMNGKLIATAACAQRAVVAAISQSALNECTIGRRGLGIPILGPNGGAGALHILPLHNRRNEDSLGAVAALFVAETDTSFVAPTEMAAALFDLTPAEARIFDHLVTGHTQAAIAAALHIERSTLKTHLSRVYDKVGVRRQVDLVRVAASLAIPAEIST